jgi:hypothetical protein
MWCLGARKGTAGSRSAEIQPFPWLPRDDVDAFPFLVLPSVCTSIRDEVSMLCFLVVVQETGADTAASPHTLFPLFNCLILILILILSLSLSLSLSLYHLRTGPPVSPLPPPFHLHHRRHQHLPINRDPTTPQFQVSKVTPENKFATNNVGSAFVGPEELRRQYDRVILSLLAIFLFTPLLPPPPHSLDPAPLLVSSLFFCHQPSLSTSISRCHHRSQHDPAIAIVPCAYRFPPRKDTNDS